MEVDVCGGAGKHVQQQKVVWFYGQYNQIPTKEVGLQRIEGWGYEGV
jgi:hypothetical protein